MRSIRNYILLAATVLLVAACNNNTYSGLREKENKLIENYISRKGIEVIKEEPAEDYVWPENVYLDYTIPLSGYGNFYFHLISRGKSTMIDSVNSSKKDTISREILNSDVVVVRYKQFGLTENPDTMSFWTTLDQPYPMEFHYGNFTECEAAAWQYAVKLMKYPDSQCEIIVPSKAGFSTEQQSVTPYVYILKIKVKQ